MLPKETIVAGAEPHCDLCNSGVNVEVCQGMSGWYIGTDCSCGPFSRETEYFASEEEARKALPVVESLVGMRRTNYSLAHDPEVCAELNLKWKDHWDWDAFEFVIKLSPWARIRNV